MATSTATMFANYEQAKDAFKKAKATYDLIKKPSSAEQTDFDTSKTAWKDYDYAPAARASRNPYDRNGTDATGAASKQHV